jgi:hypothetical protein
MGDNAALAAKFEVLKSGDFSKLGQLLLELPRTITTRTGHSRRALVKAASLRWARSTPSGRAPIQGSRTGG